MLPRGASGDLASFRNQQAFRSLHPDAQTVALLHVGRCSCDFVRPRLSDEREDERHLRERYRQLGVSRDRMIPALERHRRGASVRGPKEGWPAALASFVAEHARNAGPSLYCLDFSAEGGPVAAEPPVRTVPLSQVLADPKSWLVEGRPALVAR